MCGGSGALQRVDEERGALGEVGAEIRDARLGGVDRLHAEVDRLARPVSAPRRRERELVVLGDGGGDDAAPSIRAGDADDAARREQLAIGGQEECAESPHATNRPHPSGSREGAEHPPLGHELGERLLPRARSGQARGELTEILVHRVRSVVARPRVEGLRDGMILDA